MTPQENLAKLGYKLPNVSTPGGSYVSVNIRENIAYIAIQFPILNEVFKYQGRLGVWGEPYVNPEQRNLSLLNIGLGASTMIMSTWNLIANRK